MNIERALRNYLKSTGPKVKDKDFLMYSNGDATINVLFKLANEEIDNMTNQKTLDRVVEMLKLGEIILKNEQDLNRRAIARKIVKLEEKLDRIVFEGKKKFSNLNKIKSEFNKVRRELDILLDINEEKDTKQYDFMRFLIEETKDITYLEYTLKKMPGLANVKDKNEVPLFRNIIKNYLDSIYEFNEADEMYYDNLLSLIISQKKFSLSNNDKRDCLNDIYKFVDKISYSKKNAKKYKEKLNSINQLVDKIKGLNISSKDLDEIASKYNIHIRFRPELLEDLKLVREEKEGQMTDKEEVDEYIISMDGEEAIEIDDALSCRKLDNGNYLLGVHIGSVLQYFPYDSEIVQEAIYRNQSIYLPYIYQTIENDFHRTVPIFPYDFAADMGSLVEGKPRLTRSYFFEISPKGEIVNERFPKTIIRNNRRLTYDEVNGILENGTDDEKLGETIKNLREVTEILDANYKENDLYRKIKENSKDVSELRVKKIGAENIVYQSMLLTGNRVAMFFARNNYPFIYRVHEINEENNKKLQAMIDNLNQTYGGEQFKNLYQLIEGLYPRGWYAMEGSHSGLGLENYCHCTSEYRRAADIVAEYALETCYDKVPTEEELQKLREEIAEKIILINSRQSPIEYFVKEYKNKYHRR